MTASGDGLVAYEELKQRQSVMESLGERREELRRAWVDLFESQYRSNDEIAHTREYLLVAGNRR